MWFPFGIIGTDALAGVYFVLAEAAVGALGASNKGLFIG